MTPTTVAVAELVRTLAPLDALERRNIDAVLPAEFSAARWWDIDSTILPESDPHLDRFLTKVGAALTTWAPPRRR